MPRFSTSLVLVAFLLNANGCLAGDLIGTWTLDEGTVRVAFERCGDAICGDVVWVKPGGDTEAKAGQRLFFDMRPNGNNSWMGKATYSGSIYVSSMSIKETVLRTTGCIMVGLFCKSGTWRRGAAR
jgi:uncharacterized protein (DUF2147 family)